MTAPQLTEPRSSTFRRFLEAESSGGLFLMGVAVLAILVANSPLAPGYFAALHAGLGPMSAELWINDGLMAIFFVFVGLEIKREMLEGQLSSWSRRILPGVAAAAGMLVPALIYVAFNRHDAMALRGWAIPSATDIAFALGVISLLGSRVPASLKVFLAALAIIDDLGAVVIIALFYSDSLSLPYLLGAAVVLVALVVLNKRGVRVLWPFLLLGLLLWFMVLRSGVHATISGVLLALTIPLGTEENSPLKRLEHVLSKPVSFIIVPIFGFANAGVSFAGVGPDTVLAPLTLGVALGLLVGKTIGVFGSVAAMVGLRLAPLPHGATWRQMFGTAILCGIGFTMSLFIGLLAFANSPALQSEVKFGIIGGSIMSGILGCLVLRTAPSRQPH